MNAKSRDPKPASHQPNAAAKLHAPLARLLRPLVRLCIRSGMTFPALAQLLRELFVNVAEHDFALEGKEQTDSRVSLLTGIHRKEVARLRGAGAPVHEAPATLSRTSAIIARWLAAPEFTDAKGEPLPLPRTAEGDAPSFEQLVESITKDVRPRAVLDEWLDRKLVTINGDDEIVLIDTGFVPHGDDDRKWHYLGRNLHDHVAAAAENVSGRAALPGARGALRRPVAEAGEAAGGALARACDGSIEGREPRSQPRARQGQGRQQPVEFRRLRLPRRPRWCVR